MPVDRGAEDGIGGDADSVKRRGASVEAEFSHLPVMGREVVVAITHGKLDFGPWEQIFYGEFDGRRRKRVLVKIIGE